MEPATGMNRLDGRGGAVASTHGDCAPLADHLLSAATEALRAMAELPDERVGHELDDRGSSPDLDVEALTWHIFAATRALSLAEAALQARVAGLAGGGVST